MDKRTRVVFLCDWLPPDFGAVGQYELAAARRHARCGRWVTLVGFSSRDDSEHVDLKGEGQLLVRRIYRPTYNRSTWFQRAIWTLRSNLSLVWNARREIFHADEIRLTGSPPYLVHFVMPIAMLLRKPTRYRVSDFHPECLIAVLGHTPWWLVPIYALTRFWRRRVTVFEVLGHDQQRRLVAQGISEERIVLKPDTAPVEITGREEGRFRPGEMAGRMIVLYSGNWGRAHDATTFISAVKGLDAEARGRLGIWLNCIGKETKDVYEALNALPGLLIKHTPPCPLEQLPEVLASADCQLITLKDAFVGYVLPSKVYGCIASGKQILYIGSRESDVHLLCSERAVGRYHQADCGDWVKVARILDALIRAHHRSESVG